MHKIYNFCITSIAAGHTILIYKGWPSKTAKHVKSADRLELRAGVMFCDGQSVKGYTICRKP